MTLRIPMFYIRRKLKKLTVKLEIDSSFNYSCRKDKKPKEI